MDDVLLIDPGFGASGFYLPFDPAQTGDIYSQYNGGERMDPNLGWDKTFDGNEATFSQPSRVSGGIGTWTYPGNGIPVNSTLKFVLISNGSGADYKVNGTTYSKDKKEFTAEEVGGFFKSLEINNTSGSQYCLTKAIYVDGSPLVDHSSVGVDLSGNNNNCRDQGLT